MAVVSCAALLYCVSVIDRARAAGMHRDLWEHQVQSQENEMRTDTATAIRFVGATDAKGFPVDAAWEIAAPVRFDTDWQGLNGDRERETQVRLMWTTETLFLRFDAKYRVLTVFADGDVEGRRDHLWDRDVCEAFLQPDPSQLRRYKELEVAPNGFFIDLDIDAGAGSGRDLKSGLRRRVDVDSASKTWRAVLAVPMKSIVERFDPKAAWHANFYRVEGPAEPRFYSAWQPTRTEKPSFHVPEAFGKLVFAESAAR
jgi:Carbohydrate-binding family 9